MDGVLRNETSVSDGCLEVQVAAGPMKTRARGFDFVQRCLISGRAKGSANLFPSSGCALNTKP